MAASSSTSSSRRRFFLKLAVFLFLIAGLDAGVGSLLRHFYFTQKSGLNFQTTYALEQSRDDIIVLGSSRAQAHYLPSILETRLGGSCYNAGRNGQSLLYASAVHNAVLSRQAPRIVILDIILADFYQYHGHYDRLAALLPYYRGNEAVRPVVRLRSPFEPLKLMSGIYPFNSLPLQIIKYNLKAGGPDNGFVAQHGTIKLPLHPARPIGWLKNGIDEHMIRTFEDIVASCIENDVKLYPVISPGFDGNIFGREAIEVIEEMLAGTPYRLWDYSDQQEFLRNPELFRDRDHLNEAGSRMFTEMFASRIEEGLESGVLDRTAGITFD